MFTGCETDTSTGGKNITEATPLATFPLYKRQQKPSPPDVDKILCKFPGIERPGKATCENAACCYDVDLGANACYKPAVREQFS